MRPSQPLAPFLDTAGFVVVDGGLATELEARGHDLSDALWSARCVLEAPDSVRAVHRDYLQAGADVILAAGYQVSTTGFEAAGRTRAEAETCLRLSVELALEARDTFWSRGAHRVGRQRPLVAASIGPYGASRADGSEYRGDDGLSVDALADWHRERWDLLTVSGAGLLACETIPSLREGQALARLFADTPGVCGWLSFSCRDGANLSDGTPFREAVQALEATPGLVALGINCTAPQHIEPLLRSAAGESRCPWVVYPNSGEPWDATSRSWGQADATVSLAGASRRWYDLGARLLGGCCRTRPADIAAIRKALQGHT